MKDSRDGDFWNRKIETMSLDELRAVQEERLLKQLQYTCSASEFYRRKFDAAGVKLEDIKSLDDVAKLPFTSKEEIRESLDSRKPLGKHIAVRPEDVIRIHSSTGTTGKPTYTGITLHDREVWTEIVSRTLFAQGIRSNSRVVHGFGLSFFVGGLPLKDAVENIGATFIPVGTGASDRIFSSIIDLEADVLLCTPSYAIYLAEFAKQRGIDPGTLSIKRISSGAEPGVGIPSVKRKIVEEWGGAKVTEGLGNADMAPIIFGECEVEQGMHFCGQEYIVPEIIDPETGDVVEMVDGAEGELVYTSIDRECCPLLRFRTRDHVIVRTSPCSCGRTSFRIRCVGRTDDMLIVLGVNVFPSAIRDVVGGFRPDTTGEIQVVLDEPGPKAAPPLQIQVEYGNSFKGDLSQLKRKIETVLRDKLVFQAKVHLVEEGALPRYEMKAQLIKKNWLK
jgi:phenylacetate-CoA ligase